MAKPSRVTIGAALPISRYPARGVDPIAVCNVCGEPSRELGVWREHDERDLPLAGDAHLVFIGRDHAACQKAMEKHPRLYEEVRGAPGHFPRLCGDCVQRRGFACTDPRLTSNGGEWLTVTLSGFGVGMILCGVRGRRGCYTPLTHATKCEGRRTLALVHDEGG